MKYSREVQIGGSLVLAALLFYVGQRFFRDLPLFAGTHSYITVAQDAAGIIPGNAVRINGVYVGSVTDVRINEGAAWVGFTVSTDVRLPHGTTAILGGFGFVGDVRLDLILGPPDTTYYAPGDIIPESPREDMLADLAAYAPALLAQLDSLLSGASSTFSATDALLSSPEGELRQSIHSVGATATALTDLLNAESAQIGATLEDVRTLAHALSALAADSLTTTVEELNRVIAQLQDNLTGLARTTAALNIFLERINSGHGTLGKLATDDQLYNSTAEAAAALRRLLEDFEQNPRKYLKDIRLVDIF